MPTDPGGDPVSIIKLFFTFFLVLLNGFFVAAEFAIVKVRSSQIEVKTGLNKSISAAAKSILSNLDAYLAATQLGITLASLGLGWVGEEVMTHLILRTFSALNLPISEATAHSWSMPIAFCVITILHIVFGELAPKSLAIRYPTKTTFFVSLPLKVFYFVGRPAIWILNGLANFILRIFGIKPIHGSEIHSEEELKVIITESHEGGAIEETERALIQNVFEFDDRRVSNIQTLRKNISAIEITMNMKEAIDYAIQEGYSRYPVYEETMDNIKGVLYTKDMIRHLFSRPEDKSIEPLLRKATFISEGSKIKNVLKEFQQKHIQMAVVTNEIGELTGIVTMEDILEELVGEIQDEYDNEKPIVEKTSEHTYLVNAHYTLSDINKYIPFRLAEGEHYETLAGLITELNQDKELTEGGLIDIDKYDAVIVKMYRNSVETVQLKVKDAFIEN
ncbi:HlyC/CorC family transporter [Taibaiella lutea]|uniref:HlyC/CorC family transporter n=1 Tax=Taibaiella lutea TaxID=2608001 RepID=A0A5M6CRQ3_9BACT|nr:hemolysin family protein [Taibaiella lutea]KAA5537060.1 HlyC/CorC family transporter [Taibaiella lutea]